MPTVFRHGPYRFFFYAGDRDEPAHVHVECSDGEAKFWLDPIELARNDGIRALDLRQIQRLIATNQATLEEKWRDYFGH